ncbi:MAG: NAD(P)H-dependent oxidoreductase [Pauljensenia sp.]
MTRVLVVYDHPYEGSYNRAVLEEVLDALRDNHVDHDLIDLHADGFEPAYDTAELALFRHGGTTDPLVERYQGLISSATDLVIVAPVWWNDVPAMLKGFVDKVMKQEWAYVPTPRGVEGRLGHLRSALVLTTSTSPTFYLRLVCGDAIRRVLVGTTLRQLGIRHRRWMNLGRVNTGGQGRRETHLRRVRAHLSTAFPRPRQ